MANTKARAVTINVKMDIAVKHDIVKATLKKHPLATILIFNEVSNVKLLRTKLPRGWALLPYEQYVGKNGRVGTQYIAVKSSVWLVQEFVNRDISQIKHARRMLGAVLVHRRSKKRLYVFNLHVDPLGNGIAAASPPGRNQQYRENKQFAENVGRVFKYDPNANVLVAGDTNQHPSQNAKLPNALKKYDVKEIMSLAGLKQASSVVKAPGKVALLQEFVSKNVKVTKRVGYHPAGFPDSVLDHEVVFIEIEI